MTLQPQLYAGLEGLQGRWDRLAADVDAPPWHRHGWFARWFTAFGHGTPQVIALREDHGERLVALAPLIERHGVLHSPANWHTPSYAFLAVDEAARATLVRYVLSMRRPIALRFVDDASPDLDLLRSGGERSITRPLERSPYVSLDGPFTGLEARLGRSMLSEIRRRRRRLSEQGEVSLDVTDGRDGRDLDRLLDEGFRIEGSGWKSERGTAINSDPAVERFYRTVAIWASDAGWLRLAFLRVGGRSVAFQLLLEHGGALAQLKGGYDPAFRKLAPGVLLVHGLLGWASERRLATYEFLGDEAPFKQAFTSQVSVRLAVGVFPSTAHGLTRYGVEAVGRPALRRARAALSR